MTKKSVAFSKRSRIEGRLNELMSQIRMQSQTLAAKTETRYTLDDNIKVEIKQHLENQQNGILQLISIIKDDLDDLKTIEQGLDDAIHQPRR